MVGLFLTKSNVESLGKAIWTVSFFPLGIGGAWQWSQKSCSQTSWAFLTGLAIVFLCTALYGPTSRSTRGATPETGNGPAKVKVFLQGFAAGGPCSICLNSGSVLAVKSCLSSLPKGYGIEVGLPRSVKG